MKILLFSLFIINASIGMEPNVKLPSFAELLASISDSQQLNPVQNTQQKNTPLSASAHPAKPKPNKRPYKRKTPPATHPNQFNFSQQPAHIPLMFLSDHPKAKSPNKNN